MFQYSIFAEINTTLNFFVGDRCECNLPCPQRLIAGYDDEYGYLDRCYNYMAKVEVVSILPNSRAICRNMNSLSNHTGWTIVPFEFLEYLYDD